MLENAEEYAEMMLIGGKAIKSGTDNEAIFKMFSAGVKSNRDDIVYDFDQKALMVRLERFIDDYNAEVDRFKRSGKRSSVDEFVRCENIKWSEGLKSNLVRGREAKFEASKVKVSLYRPFTKKYLFFDNILVERRYQCPRFYPSPLSEGENLIIVVGGYERKAFSVFISSLVVDLNFYADPVQCFPVYVYDEDGTNRGENITDWALGKFQGHYSDDSISKWDVFYYVYGVLHQPAYREKYSDNLKRELPHIPFMEDFRAFAEAGKRLADLHLNYERVEPWPLTWICVPREPLSYRVEKMRLSKDKSTLIVNETLSLGDIPPETFQYRLGNRSALEWVIDQYQVYEDPRSGIRSDPNRKDDPEYIVRLVEQVVRVSVETVRIVNGLPAS